MNEPHSTSPEATVIATHQSQEIVIDEALLEEAMAEMSEPISMTDVVAHREHDKGIRKRSAESSANLVVIDKKADEIHKTYGELAEADSTDALKVYQDRLQEIEASRSIAIASINAKANRALEKVKWLSSGRIERAELIKEQSTKVRAIIESINMKYTHELSRGLELQAQYEVSRDHAITVINDLFAREEVLMGDLAAAQGERDTFNTSLSDSDELHEDLLKQERALKSQELKERNFLAHDAIQALRTDNGIEEEAASEAIKEAAENIRMSVSSIKLDQILHALDTWQQKWNHHDKTVKNLNHLIDEYTVVINQINAELGEIPEKIEAAQRALELEQTFNARQIEVFSLATNFAIESYSALLHNDTTPVLLQKLPARLRRLYDELEKLKKMVATSQEIDNTQAWATPVFDTVVPLPIREEIATGDDGDEDENLLGEQQMIKNINRFEGGRGPFGFVGKIQRGLSSRGIELAFRDNREIEK